MPTVNQYRTARTLLGLTQSQVATRMGISVSALRSLETDNDVVPERKYAQYYDCWLREYTRNVKGDLLSTMDTILSNDAFARMFHIVEPNHKSGKPHITVINETGMAFDTTADAAQWLIDNGFTSGNKTNVAQRIRNAVKGTGPTVYLGFTYRYEDEVEESTDIDTEGLNISDLEHGFEIVENGKRFPTIKACIRWVRKQKNVGYSIATMQDQFNGVIDNPEKELYGYHYQSF